MNRSFLAWLLRQSFIREDEIEVEKIAEMTDDEVIDAARVLWGGQHVSRGRWRPLLSRHEWRNLVRTADSYKELKLLALHFSHEQSALAARTLANGHRAQT